VCLYMCEHVYVCVSMCVRFDVLSPLASRVGDVLSDHDLKKFFFHATPQTLLRHTCRCMLRRPQTKEQRKEEEKKEKKM